MDELWEWLVMDGRFVGSAYVHLILSGLLISPGSLRSMGGIRAARTPEKTGYCGRDDSLREKRAHPLQKPKA